MEKDLKVLIISESIGRERFGVAQVLLELFAYFGNRPIDLRVICILVGDVPEAIRDQVKHIPVPAFSLSENILARISRWSPKMRSEILKEIETYQPDLIHIHGVFTPLQQAAQFGAARSGIPVLLSVHGMLEPWTWNQHGVVYRALKRLYWNLILRPRMRKVDYIQAITSLEAKTLQQEFPNSKQILIPNAINLASIPDIEKQDTFEKSILFLGRIHPKKGVHTLVEAFHLAGVKGWKLKIAGPVFSKAYLREIKDQIKLLNIEDNVEFLGPIYGDDKYRLMARSWVAVVPSSSEVVGLVNLEAASVHTPAITTHATGLSDWEEGGGILVDDDPIQLSKAIESATSWTLDERMRRGNASRNLLEKQYSWQSTGPLWEQAYRLVASKKITDVPRNR
jgi:glycosyltransferase involved in cell wall biosynthesis